MKQIFPILLFIFTISTFGQENEYNTAQNLYLAKNYKESLEYTEKLLNNDFGEINDYVKVYVLSMNANSHYQLKNYKLAFDRYDEYLNFIKTTPLKLFSKSDKKKLVNEITKLLEDIKQSYPLALSESNPASDNTTSSSLTNNSNLSSNNSDQTVTLVVSAKGNTKEEAQQKALRSAIEQAFGAFISSKTEILNDDLVKDEIVSITNGSIQKYEVVSEIQLADGIFVSTLKATVSVTKLTGFFESKGIAVEIKGALFVKNMRMQMLNEEAEFKVIENLVTVSQEWLSKSLDWKLNIKEPKSIGNNMFQIKIGITGEANLNYKNWRNYVISTIKSISMTKEEFESYKNVGKNIFNIYFSDHSLDQKCLRFIHFFSDGFDPDIFYIRNEKSFKSLIQMMVNAQQIEKSFALIMNDSITLTPQINYQIEYNNLSFWNSEGDTFYFPYFLSSPSFKYEFSKNKYISIDQIMNYEIENNSKNFIYIMNYLIPNNVCKGALYGNYMDAFVNVSHEATINIDIDNLKNLNSIKIITINKLN
ncbi:MAG: hypothetical protein Q8Q51_05150 [Lutibacter sp.]|nr:hypothetical protein [Lutibacter sp.]